VLEFPHLNGPIIVLSL